MRSFSLAMLSCLLLFGTAQADLVTVTPEEGLFQFREGLAGQHPRLHFTEDDIADIRTRAAGPASFFYEQAVAAFGHYVGQAVDDSGANAWKAYLFGFWGQFTMDLMYLVEEDAAYADTAIAWALTYARRSDWLADDLIPMDILSGMALTYDILYERLSESERVELRTAIFQALEFMHAEFYEAEYWTQDYQNNHMHNRIHGYAHGALAILGDDPANTPTQRHADLAYGSFLDALAWLPEDGSNHEGPGYWSYGHHWLVRTAALFRHCTGQDDTAGHGHFAQAHWFRILMSTPGWQGTFNIGDGGAGPPGNPTPLALGIAESEDAMAQCAYQTLMETQAGEFYQHPAWGVLWYDETLVPASIDDLPLSRFWPDLDMLSIRSGWSAEDTGFVFKCGPPGGHLMQQLRGSGWVNVAHDHPDQNHFLIWAHGTMLAEDDGYPKEQKLTRSHNTITVDGAGQTREGSAWYQPFDYALCGRMMDVFLSGKSAFASGDASNLYDGADRVHRHVLWMEGEFLVVLDDLRGASGGERDFQWRLHKDGIWSEEDERHYRVSDGEAGLDIRFLEPEVATAEFLPAELTAAPCLALGKRASQTRFLSLLTPQRNGAPELQFESIDSGSTGKAVRVTGPHHLTRAAWSLDAGSISFDGVEAEAAAVALRENLSIMMRGTSLRLDGQDWLWTDNPVDLARRDESDRILLEAEAPHGENGGATQLGLGGLAVLGRYRRVPGESLHTSDTQGRLTLGLDLASRQKLTLLFEGPVDEDGGLPDAGTADAGNGDAGQEDSGENDAGLVGDDGPTSEQVEGSCGCQTSTPSRNIFFLLLSGLIILLRRLRPAERRMPRLQVRFLKAFRT